MYQERIESKIFGPFHLSFFINSCLSSDERFNLGLIGSETFKNILIILNLIFAEKYYRMPIGKYIRPRTHNQGRLKDWVYCKSDILV